MPHICNCESQHRIKIGVYIFIISKQSEFDIHKVTTGKMIHFIPTGKKKLFTFWDVTQSTMTVFLLHIHKIVCLFLLTVNKNIEDSKVIDKY